MRILIVLKIAIEHRELKRQENEKRNNGSKKETVFHRVPKYRPGRTHEEITGKHQKG